MSNAVLKPVLAARSVSKRFPGVLALQNVDLDIYAGQVNAILGENGAGKSTLMKILSGVYTEYEGSLLLDDEPVRFTGPRHAQDLGIAIIHQELNLIPHLTVAENIFLGREPLTRLGFIDYRKMADDTRALLQKLNSDIHPNSAVENLRVGQQQIVEIAKSLSLNARIIIMDEPTSAISEHEVDILFGLIKSLKADGVAIVYITHKLDELDKIADAITIFRDGKYITSGPAAEFTQDDIICSMVGRDMDDFFVKDEVSIGEDVLQVENLSLKHPARVNDYLLKDVSFHVKKGEVLGIFGLMGAGRTELFDCIFGVYGKSHTGSISIDGINVSIENPQQAIEAGIGYVHEDRKSAGLIIEMSVAENISLADIQQVEKFGFLSSQAEQNLAKDYIQQLKIKTPGTTQAVEKLSGGNQQKVVIAKWLATHPRILFLDEPTRGVDVGAKNEIYKLISELAGKGLGIIMVSSELPEVLAISDRILVMSEGQLTGEFTPSQATEEKLLSAAIPKSIEA